MSSLPLEKLLAPILSQLTEIINILNQYSRLQTELAFCKRQASRLRIGCA